MSVTYRLEMRGLERLIKELPQEADAVVRATALSIEGRAKVAAPVDTGFLRSSIRMRDETPGDAKAEVVVGAEYGLSVERGIRQRPQPYLEPAVDAERGPFEAALAALVRRLGD